MADNERLDSTLFDIKWLLGGQKKLKLRRYTAAFCKALDWKAEVHKDGVAIIEIKPRGSLSHRAVCVIESDDGNVVMVSDSRHKLPRNWIPGELLWAALRQNDENVFGKWSLIEWPEKGKYYMSISHASAGTGLTPKTFEHFCVMLATAADRFDMSMVKMGIVK